MSSILLSLPPPPPEFVAAPRALFGLAAAAFGFAAGFAAAPFAYACFARVLLGRFETEGNLWSSVQATSAQRGGGLLLCEICNRET